MAQFKSILRSHMMLSCHRYTGDLLKHYGNKERFAPSPLLSALISGGVEKGRDLTAGGARYYIFSPLLVGVSNAADSLYVIDELLFKKRQFTLQELTSCLASDWGHSLLLDQKLVAFGPHVDKSRIDEIRELCLAQPKFENGDKAVNTWAWWLLDLFVDCIYQTFNHPVHKPARQRLEKEYGSRKYPFEISLAAGVGTFEQYVLMGVIDGAPADGRRSRGPLASDLSPSPIPNDKPAAHSSDGRTEHARTFGLADSLRSFSHPVMRKLGDGAPVDLPPKFEMSNFVYVQQGDNEPEWCVNGTYLAYRKIRRRLSKFFALEQAKRETVFGVNSKTGLRVDQKTGRRHPNTRQRRALPRSIPSDLTLTCSGSWTSRDGFFGARICSTTDLIPRAKKSTDFTISVSSATSPSSTNGLYRCGK